MLQHFQIDRKNNSYVVIIENMTEKLMVEVRVFSRIKHIDFKLISPANKKN